MATMTCVRIQGTPLQTAPQQVHCWAASELLWLARHPCLVYQLQEPRRWKPACRGLMCCGQCPAGCELQQRQRLDPQYVVTSSSWAKLPGPSTACMRTWALPRVLGLAACLAAWGAALADGLAGTTPGTALPDAGEAGTCR